MLKYPVSQVRPKTGTNYDSVVKATRTQGSTRRIIVETGMHYANNRPFRQNGHMPRRDADTYPELPRYTNRSNFSAQQNEEMQWHPIGVKRSGNVIMRLYERQSPYDLSFKITSVAVDPDSGLPIQEFKYTLSKHSEDYEILIQQFNEYKREKMAKYAVEAQKNRRVNDLEPDYEADLEPERDRLHAAPRRR